MNYRIGICDTDSHYSMGLMEYINMHVNIPLKCSAFSSEESMKEYVARDDLDIIIMDENMRWEDDSRIPVIRTTAHRMKADGERVIYKYQNADIIVESIIGCLKKERDKDVVGQRIYAVYSPLGRCGCTRFAMGICSCHKDSLYVGLENYPVILSDMNRENYLEQEKMMYYLLSKNNKLLEDMSYAGRHEAGFRYITGSVNFADNRQIEAQHIRWLCDILKKDKSINRIVFDISTGTMSDISLLDSFDSIFVPILDDVISRKKLNVFRRLMSEGSCSVYEDKINEICVPDGAYDSIEMRTYVEVNGL